MNTRNFNTGAYASTSELAKHNNNMLWPYCHGKYTAMAVARLSEWLAQDGVKLTEEMAAGIMHYFITTEDDIVHLIEGDITVRELAAMTDPEPFIIACWKEAGLATVLFAKALYPCEGIKMSMDEFLSHCTPCGGNWGGLLLSGINELFPEVYKVIPDDMGINAFGVLCELLRLLGIDTNEKA